jgi:hypothetical protein
LIVAEEAIAGGEAGLVQSRVAIDRVTGGAYPTALFNEQPVFGGPDTAVRMTLRVENPEPAEVGLLLLVLKDLWTGDLPVGGGAAIGRGRLVGRQASIDLRQGADSLERWEITARDGSLAISGDRDQLEDLVAALGRWLAWTEN